MIEHKPLQIFVSYSHEDSAWIRRLFNEYIQTTFGDCRIWTDAQIRVGQQWGSEIQRHLEGSSVAILLVSKCFLKSKFIMANEYPRILQRNADAHCRVVWIPVNIKEETIRRLAPDLLKIQWGTGFREALPASSDAGVDPDMVERVRLHIRGKVQAAVDPVGAELARLVTPRYDIREWLGEGNLASIYRARDNVLERNVAIKVLKDKDQRDRFMDDVRIAIQTSDHPGFVNIYDADMGETATYCVLQLVEGQNLRQRIIDYPQGLPIERIRRIFLVIASALARAHAMGVTYGNIKPSNIIFNQDNEPFILPVGRRRDGSRYARRLADLLQRIAQRAALGQPPDEPDREDLVYLLPEHFDQQYEEIDSAKSDQYMLGLLAYEMISGTPPVTISGPDKLVAQGCSAFVELPSLTSIRPLVPQRIANMVARMTSRRQAKRYPNLQAVLDEARMFEDLSLSIAKDSYHRCAAQAGFDLEFFQRFYREFIRLCPKAQSYFDKFGPGDWSRQHRMLKQAVLLLFAFRQQSEGKLEPNVLSRIAATHQGIPAYFYDLFVDALIHTVCGHATAGLKAFDPQCVDNVAQRELIEDHWRKSIEPAVRYMKERTSMAQASTV